MIFDFSTEFDAPHFDAGVMGADGCLARLHKGGGGVPKPSKKEMQQQRKQGAMFAKMMAGMSRQKAEAP